MPYRVKQIEGIGSSLASKLEAAAIRTTDDLLTACASARGRKETAERTGIDAKRLLQWTNMADLMRISGIGEEYSELLEAAGVDTVKELRTRRPETLHASMLAANRTKKLVRQVPALSQVTKWVEQAKTLEPMITH